MDFSAGLVCGLVIGLLVAWRILRKPIAEAARLLAEWWEEGIHEPRNIDAVRVWMSKCDLAKREQTPREKTDRQLRKLRFF